MSGPYEVTWPVFKGGFRSVPVTPKRSTPFMMFPATSSASPATVPAPLWYPAAIVCSLVPGTLLTAPLSGIVPLCPRPAPLENVWPSSTSAAAAVPPFTVARSAEQLA